MQLKTIEVAKEIRNSLQTPMPDYIIKEKPGQAKASYVTGQSVIDKLNATFGYAGWSWRIKERFIQQSVDKVIKDRWDNQARKKVPLETPIVENQLPVAHVVGELTVYFERPDGSIHAVTKEAPGAQPITGGQSEQENCFKGAHTDALKKAATLFGIALELYRDENEQYFHDDLNYENPWNEETMKKHEEDWSVIRAFRTEYSLTDEDMDAYLVQYSNGSIPSMGYLMPENITGFVDYLKKIVESATAKGA